MKSLPLLSSSIFHHFASRSIASLPRRRNRVRTRYPSVFGPVLPILSRPISSGKVFAMAEETSSTTSQKHTNRLAAEHSPYLLQHAHNPVIKFALFYKVFIFTNIHTRSIDKKNIFVFNWASSVSIRELCCNSSSHNWFRL